jgi:hypothetical protein
MQNHAQAIPPCTGSGLNARLAYTLQPYQLWGYKHLLTLAFMRLPPRCRMYNSKPSCQAQAALTSNYRAVQVLSPALKCWLRQAAST